MKRRNVFLSAMKTLRHIIHLLFKILSILMAVALLLSYLSIYINPEKMWIPAFFGLFFLPLFLLNILLSATWLIVRRKTAWINVCSLIPSLFYLPLFIQVHINNPIPADTLHQIKIMSYNVTFSDYWGKKKIWLRCPVLLNL